MWGGMGGQGIASDISGTKTQYAGGGQGSSGMLWACTHSQASFSGLGAASCGGGGVSGLPNACNAARNGTAGTAYGAGGGAAGGGASGGTGGAGYQGVVIIRYPQNFKLAASTTGSPTLTNVNGFNIYTWTSTGSGSITF